MDWKSLYALILRAPLCGANNTIILINYDHPLKVKADQELIEKARLKSKKAKGQRYSKIWQNILICKFYIYHSEKYKKKNKSYSYFRGCWCEHRKTFSSLSWLTRNKERIPFVFLYYHTLCFSLTALSDDTRPPDTR